MEMDISGATLKNIMFAPNVTEEIIQNVKTILATEVESVVLDRGFGIVSATDAPIPVAQARLSAAYVAAVQKYEPRAKVLSITFANGEGKLIPTVRIGVVE